jgi:hypothetical protein
LISKNDIAIAACTEPRLVGWYNSALETLHGLIDEGRLSADMSWADVCETICVDSWCNLRHMDDACRAAIRFALRHAWHSDT